MADQNPTSWDRLFAGLHRDVSEHNDTAAAKALEDLREVSKPGVSETDFHQQIRHLFETYGERYNLTPSTVNIDGLLNEASVWREQNYIPTEEQPAQGTAAPQAPTLKEFLPRESGGGGGGDGGHGGVSHDYQGKLLEKLHATQKNQVLQEFEQLLASVPADQLSDKLPELLDNFYRTHLSAAGVVGRQYQILQDQTRKLYGKTPEYDDHADSLRQEADAVTTRLRETQQIGPVRDAELQAQRDVENTNMSILKQHAGDREFLRSNIDSLFDSEWNRRQQDINTAVDRFAHTLGFAYEDYVRGYDAIATTVETQYQEEEAPPEPIPQGAPPGGTSGRGGVAKGARKAAERGFNEALEAERTAASGAEAAEAAAGLAAGAEEGSIFLFLTTNPVGITILVILAIIAAFLLIFLIVMLLVLVSGGGINPGGTPPPTGTAVHPTPSYFPTDYRTAIRQTFKIDITGMYSYEYKWAWEKLWDVSNTRFVTLLDKASLTMDIGNGTSYTAHRGTSVHIHLHHFSDQNGFDVIFIHELSHAISFVNPNSATHWTDLPKAVVEDVLYSIPSSLDGWLTLYSRYGCLYHPPTYGIQLGEDYAEMLAYYLNTNVGMLTACGSGPWPYANGAHPFHYRLAQQILGPY